MTLVKHLVPACGDFLSAVASAYLLCRLCKLPTFRKGKLLVRQLTQLGAASLAFALSNFAYLLVSLAEDFGMPKVYDQTAGCIAISAIIDASRNVAYFIEVHLALSFAASLYGYGASRFLKCLSRGLVLVWPCAIMLAALQNVLALYSARPANEPNSPWCARTAEEDPVLKWNGVVCGLLCSVCYGWSCALALRAGASVRRDIWCRAQGYVLVSILTVVPVATYAATGDLFGIDPDLSYLLVAGVSSLLGLAHFLVYALQSSYAKHIRRLEVPRLEPESADGRPTTETSFRVNFNDVSVSYISDPWSPEGTTNESCIECRGSIGAQYGTDSYEDYFMDSYSQRSPRDRTWA